MAEFPDSRATASMLIENGISPTLFKKYEVEKFLKKHGGNADAAVADMEAISCRTPANEDWSQVKSKKEKKATAFARTVRGTTPKPRNTKNGFGGYIDKDNAQNSPNSVSGSGNSDNQQFGKNRGGRGGFNRPAATSTIQKPSVDTPVNLSDRNAMPSTKFSLPIKPVDPNSIANPWRQGPPISAKLMDQKNRIEEGIMARTTKGGENIAVAVRENPSENLPKNSTGSVPSFSSADRFEQTSADSCGSSMSRPEKTQSAIVSDSRAGVPIASSWAAKVVGGAAKPVVSTSGSIPQSSVEPNVSETKISLKVKASNALDTPVPESVNELSVDVKSRQKIYGQQKKISMSRVVKPVQDIKPSPVNTRPKVQSRSDSLHKGKLPEEFKAAAAESETFAFGNFGGFNSTVKKEVKDQQKPQSSWVEDSLVSKKSTEGSAVPPPGITGMDSSSQGGFISNLISNKNNENSSSNDVSSPKLRLSQSIAEGKAVNATDYESQAIAQADAAAKHAAQQKSTQQVAIPSVSKNSQILLQDPQKPTPVIHGQAYPHHQNMNMRMSQHQQPVSTPVGFAAHARSMNDIQVQAGYSRDYLPHLVSGYYNNDANTYGSNETMIYPVAPQNDPSTAVKGAYHSHGYPQSTPPGIPSASTGQATGSNQGLSKPQSNAPVLQQQDVQHQAHSQQSLAAMQHGFNYGAHPHYSVPINPSYPPTYYAGYYAAAPYGYHNQPPSYNPAFVPPNYDQASFNRRGGNERSSNPSGDANVANNSTANNTTHQQGNYYPPSGGYIQPLYPQGYNYNQQGFPNSGR